MNHAWIKRRQPSGFACAGAASLCLAFALGLSSAAKAGDDLQLPFNAAAPVAGAKKPAPTLDAEFATYEERLQTEPALKILRDAMQTFRERSQEIDKRHLELADAWFDDALQAEPTSVPLRMILAEFREIQGRPDDSIKIYRDLLKDKNIGKLPKAIVNNNLAVALSVRGSDKDLAEAATAIGAAIGELGLTADLLDTRATVRLAKQDLKGARDDLKAAIKEQPNGVLFFHLALVEDRAGNRQAMRGAMQQSLDLNLDRNQLPPTERKAFDRLRAQLTER